MTWDPTWEAVFRSRDWGRYPPEELVRFVMRHYGQVADRSQVRILEVGCGTGANLWFMAREGFSIYGIDGSQSAIDGAYTRLKGDDLADGIGWRLIVDDAMRLRSLFWPGYEFDAIIDVCCLQHNRHADIQSIVDQIHAVLKPGGRVFSMMVALGSWGDWMGTRIEPGTYTDIPEGPASGVGVTRFSTWADMAKHFAAFGDLSIEYSSRTMMERTRAWRHWVVEGVKGDLQGMPEGWTKEHCHGRIWDDHATRQLPILG